jgi:hypothetical protein
MHVRGFLAVDAVVAVEGRLVALVELLPLAFGVEAVEDDGTEATTGDAEENESV